MREKGCSIFFIPPCPFLPAFLPIPSPFHFPSISPCPYFFPHSSSNFPVFPFNSFLATFCDLLPYYCIINGKSYQPMKLFHNVLPKAALQGKHQV